MERNPVPFSGKNEQRGKANLIESLKSIVGEHYVLDSDVDKQAYIKVLVPFPHLRSDPDVIVLPGSTEEVSKILAFANKNNIPVTCKGAGSNYQTNSVPFRGGILLHFTRMDKILDINEDNLVATVEAGCHAYTLFHRLEQLGFRYPCMGGYTGGPTFGSLVGGNSQGYCSSSNGTIGEHLMGLEVVLANGEVISFGAGAASNYGYFYKWTGVPNPMWLFLQSSGTLGVVTKVSVRIKPKANFESFMTFGWTNDRLKEASQAMRHVLLHLDAINIDLWNYWSFLAATKSGALKLPAGGEGVEVFCLISHAGVSEAEIKQKEELTREVCSGYNGVDLGEYICKEVFGPPNYRLWDASKQKSATTRQALMDQGGAFYMVPLSKMPEDYALFQKVMQENGYWNDKNVPRYRGWAMMPAAFTGYPGFYCARGEEEKAWEVLQKWGQELVERGAMPYQVGVTWPKLTLDRLGPQFELTKRIKKMLDPNNILNPGHLF